MSSNLLLKTGLVAVVAGMVACNNANNQTSQENQADMKDTTTATAGSAATETSLFDGKTLTGWHGTLQMETG